MGDEITLTDRYFVSKAFSIAIYSVTFFFRNPKIVDKLKKGTSLTVGEDAILNEFLEKMWNSATLAPGGFVTSISPEALGSMRNLIYEMCFCNDKSVISSYLT